MSLDIPTDEPCYEINPDLWKRFSQSFRERFGFGPFPQPLYTEALCVQWLDTEIIGENTEKSVKNNG